MKYLKYLEDISDNPLEHVNNTEVLIDCPYCHHHKPKLSVNIETGFWQCFVCAETGGFNKLKKELKNMDKISTPKQKKIAELEKFTVHEKGLSYLISRGITNDTVLEKAGPCYQDESDSILFPYTSPESGTIIGYKARSLNTLPKKTKYKLIGEHPGLYCYDADNFNSEETSSCIIVEGEIDALSVAQYLQELNDKNFTCIASTGVTNRNCINFLEEFKSVYIWFDTDTDPKVRKIVAKSEQRFLKELSTLQNHLDIRIIKAPKNIKDPNEYLTTGYDIESFRGLLRDSQPYLEGQVNRPASFYTESMFEYLGDEIRTMGTPTLYDSIDEMLGGGKRLGELTALQAEAKTGKNTVYHCMMHRWLEAGIPVGYASRELSPEEDVIPNLLSLKYSMNMWKAKKEGKLTEKLKNEMAQAVQEWRLFFAHGYGVIDIDEITRWIQELKRKGVQFFFIDHMHYCLHDPENSREISSFIRALKTLCKEEHIHIDIIIQPKYLGADQKLGLSSLRGGSAIGQAIDNLFILKRHQGVAGHEDTLSELSLEVARHKLAQRGKKVYFSYNKETTHIIEVDIKKTEVREEPEHSIREDFSL